MPKTRLDSLLVARGLVASREQARRLIATGQVTVDGSRAEKPGAFVRDGASIEIAAQLRFVSRGGDKLEAALERFGLEVAGLVCADVGASTGGFTDCLLQRGAAKVYAIDVGHDLLAEKLRHDPRVVLLERTNARYLERLPEPVDLATVDASFISLTLLLPVARGWLNLQSPPGGEIGDWRLGIVALIKPQFEAGRRGLGKRGVVRDPEVHRRVLDEVLQFASTQGLGLRGLMASPVAGPKGNAEFLAWLALGEDRLDRQAAVDATLQELAQMRAGS
jgi:23S rRNA (cytidine1920-2'-O)/16S rRNA (cytidine1409-2'-O)-methyltransferase